MERVRGAIANHEAGRGEDLSLPLLRNIRDELVRLSSELAPARFQPSYPRFILDWPDDHGLIKQLSELAYHYSKL